MNEYIVADEYLDGYLDDIRQKATQCGWRVFKIEIAKLKFEWTLVTEPCFFPPEADAIMAAVKNALRRECSAGCRFCCMPHPMMQTGAHEYVRLCTIDVKKIFHNLARKN